MHLKIKSTCLKIYIDTFNRISKKKELFIFFILAFCVVGIALCQKMNINAHDPVMIKTGDSYYVFCTGQGISVYSSNDMINWTIEEPIFDQPPEWTAKIVTDFSGHIWAPDIHYYNGQYYLYYSISSFGKNTSAIGVAVNSTLDKSSPDYKWQDKGKVVQSIPGRDLWNAIDPNIAVDDQGNPWMTFGSFWSGMKLVKLIPNRIALAEPQEWYTIARRMRESFTEDRSAGKAAIEAPFIFKKDTSYFLFVSWDYCCRGAESTYKVVVGRSDNIKGPYIDKEGKPMTEGGGSLVIEGDENYAGVGHNSAYTFDGKDYLVFHAYDLRNEGKSKLRILEMNWDNYGWPVVNLNDK